MLGQVLRRVLADNPRLEKIFSKIYVAAKIPRKDIFNPDAFRLFLTVQPYTMLSPLRMSRLYRAACKLNTQEIEGSFVECGVWNGGSAAILASIAQRYQSRDVWLFDSWEGLPDPLELDVSETGKIGMKGMARGSEEKTRRLLFRRLALDHSKIHLVKGWFHETIQAHKEKINRIALLHLDCDWYTSVRLCLHDLYGQLVSGGLIIVDDYGYWKGCKKAVDEFLSNKGAALEFVDIVEAAAYLRKR